jgi:hypothetical protein
MSTKSGEPLSNAAQELLQLEEKYSVGGFAPTPGFLVSGKGSTLIVCDPSLYQFLNWTTNIGIFRLTDRMSMEGKSSTLSPCLVPPTLDMAIPS